MCAVVGNADNSSVLHRLAGKIAHPFSCSFTKEIREKETLNKEFSQAKKDTDRLIYKKEKLEKKIEKISNNEELSSEEKENQIAELKLQINVLNEEIKISRKDTISKFKTVSNNTNDDF